MSVEPILLVCSLVALIIGLLAGLVIGLAWRGSQLQLADRLLTRAEGQRQAETEALLDGVKLAFNDISLETFRRLADQLLTQAQTAMAGERRLYGHQLDSERGELEAKLRTVLGHFERMQQLVRDLERDRNAKFGQLEAELRKTAERARALDETTRKLGQALVNSRARGQWGERLAEDVLRAAGLVPGINYRRQAPLQDGGGRPDFTILLPQDRCVHLDVKFPFDNWRRLVLAEGEESRKRLEQAFVRDVRGRITELAAREYAQAGDSSIEVVLLLIPNEQVFANAMELAPDLVDHALERRIVLVSPMTLIAVLAVLREVIDCFALSHEARELRGELSELAHSWDGIDMGMQRLSRRLNEAAAIQESLVRDHGRRISRAIVKLRHASAARSAEASTLPEDEDAHRLDPEAGGPPEDQPASAERDAKPST